MKLLEIFLAYVTSLAIILGSGAFAINKIVGENMITAAEAELPPQLAVLAKSDASEEPFVDINDPTLFDARGEFPPALREMMAKAKRDSIRDFATVRAEYIKAAKEEKKKRKRKSAQRKVRQPPASPSRAAPRKEFARPPHQEQPRGQEAWNSGGFGFGF